jgi:hypothetical protein
VCRPIHPSSRSNCLDPFKSDEEFRLREQQGLSPLATSEYSSSGEEEEEESDGPPSERWEPTSPLTESRGGGRRASAWGGHGSVHRQAVYGRGGARCGGAGARHGVRRALEEEEA